MQWNCKHCIFSANKRGLLLKHYRLKHGGFTRQQPIPCLHMDCLCSFKSFNALKVHLSVWHSQSDRQTSEPKFAFHCQLCEYVQPCTEAEFFTHLRSHLKLKQSVSCPYEGCQFESNVYSTFNAHKSRVHSGSTTTQFKGPILSNIEQSDQLTEVDEEVPLQDDDCEESVDDMQDLEIQLERNLASLFLKMQAILHISESAAQEVIQQINQIQMLSQPLLQNAVQKIISQHCSDVDNSIVSDIVSVVSQSNVLLKFTSAEGSLSTASRRESYMRREFPVVMPVEFALDKDHSFVYVPILKMLKTLLNNKDILDKVLHAEGFSHEGYHSFRDGSHFKENILLNVEECRISLGLYIDDFEVANPIGTSKKKHKLCAVYWVLANLDSKYRSALHSIQLALLCKVNTVKEHGYHEVLRPLIQDIATLEESGVYVERLAESVKGTVLYVAADNLGAHSLAGFQESFAADYFCRFCMCKQDGIQDKEVRSGLLQPRTRENHEKHVHEVSRDYTMAKHHGVKRGCPLSEKLTHFHVVDGFPPDILHDFLEGLVPAELSLCLKDLIAKKYISLESLNKAIRQFPYTFSDKADKPQIIPKTSFSRGTTGGNGHENWSLLRLLPLMIGYNVPEGDQSWQILMLLKDTLELVMSAHFTEELIHVLDSKISEHRELLQKTFPNYRLRPKHHFIEHYPQMIQIFGPLVDVWTMRFEGKHKFFKKVVRDTCNFKNVAHTLAVRHQKMMAFHLDSSTFFKPPLEIDKVRSVMVTSFPENVQSSLHQQNGKQSSVLVASSACVHGVKYCADMIVSVGSCSGLPEFRQITHIVVINTEILLVCRILSSWYIEHLRSYELCFGGARCLTVTHLSELNDVFPLSAYRVKGNVTMESYKVRLILTDQDIRKLSLDAKPKTVEELKIKIKEKCDLQYDFNVMYEDSDFDNAFCNLEDIGDLPASRATVKVIPLLVTASTTSMSDDSYNSDDTVILPTDSSSTRHNPWPEIFDIPNFSVDVEFRLRQANLQYLRDQTYLNVTRDMKHSILEKLAETIYKFDAYPNEERINYVALALISKHPCLKEQGSPDGCSSWKHSLKFKMGNYRTKLRKAGCVEVGVNGGKTGGPGMAAKGLKRPKRSEVNYLPEHPEGQNGDSLEAVRQLLVEEMRKVNPSGTFIASKMDLTFSMRRHEIVDAETPVKTLMERWPALFTERQVFAEFHRIVTTDLQSNFYGAVDRYTPRFVTIFKSKKGTVGEKLDELMQQMNTGKEADVTAMRTLVLRGLPILLGDDASNFYNTCNACDVDGWPQVSVGLLTVIDEEEPLIPNKLYLDPVSTAIIVEGGIVLDNLQNLPQAICVLFGLTYALNLNYPKGMINTFNFIQKVMLGLGQNKLPPKLQSLKNLLLS